MFVKLAKLVRRVELIGLANIYLQGIISVVELSFMVHEPRGIIE